MEKIKASWQTPIKALELWVPEIKAVDDTANNVINIYSEIGEDFFGNGVTAKLVNGIVRKLKEDDEIVLNINSPGGDMFEGLAIYNILKEHKGSVKVKILGMAASAASVIAMAGDEIEIAESGFLMIHNSWGLVVGNSSDFRKASDDFAKFDESMAGIYANETGLSKDEIKKMMDEETWIGGGDAVDMGFATALLGEEISKEEKKNSIAALKRLDIALAKSGMSRAERRNLFKELSDTPSAVEEVTPSADDEEKIISALKELNQQIEDQTIRSLIK